ncbi:MAG TPA: hypothetical protein VNT30_21330 [Stellaceae bacterium]|nr:hypothetical protein [Stellaceae bacterium]
MYRDNSLIPIETVRIAALGPLAERDYRYGDLAAKIRYFISHIVGPSLDLMGISIEMLRYEGLVEAIEGEGVVDNALLRLTATGRAALITLLNASLRAPGTELNRLVIALKMRFLHLLPPADRQRQIDMLAEVYAGERERLTELRSQQAVDEPAIDHAGDLRGWLDHEIALLDSRLAWLDGVRRR